MENILDEDYCLDAKELHEFMETKVLFRQAIQDIHAIANYVKTGKVPELIVFTRTLNSLKGIHEDGEFVSHAKIPLIGTLQYVLFRIDGYLEDVLTKRNLSSFMEANGICGLVPFHLFSKFPLELSLALRYFVFSQDKREEYAFENLIIPKNELYNFIGPEKLKVECGYLHGNSFFVALKEKQLSGVTFYKCENLIFLNSYVIEADSIQDVFYRALMRDGNYSILLWKMTGEWIMYSLDNYWTPFGEKIMKHQINDCLCYSNTRDISIFHIEHGESERKWKVYGKKINTNY